MKTCKHSDCSGDLQRMHDPLAPSHIAIFECGTCDEVWEFDTEDGSWEVNW